MDEGLKKQAREWFIRRDHRGIVAAGIADVVALVCLFVYFPAICG